MKEFWSSKPNLKYSNKDEQNWSNRRGKKSFSKGILFKWLCHHCVSPFFLPPPHLPPPLFLYVSSINSFCLELPMWSVSLPSLIAMERWLHENQNTHVYSNPLLQSLFCMYWSTLMVYSTFPSFFVLFDMFSPSSLITKVGGVDNFFMCIISCLFISCILQIVWADFLALRNYPGVHNRWAW